MNQDDSKIDCPFRVEIWRAGNYALLGDYGAHHAASGAAREASGKEKTTARVVAVLTGLTTVTFKDGASLGSS